uniref:Uncharacterized protein n=1 Tax=Eutreptiella gymnastica TaxID=73025 RepID=A0A7S1IUN6_9EUGL|mmetsp:Transcript_4396/g.7742  ORF Transcript_4396/g.7742 Transcript_4396/m.7742 type:complete len:128 (+) Transcript_4396:480-863(+)
MGLPRKICKRNEPNVHCTPLTFEGLYECSYITMDTTTRYMFRSCAALAPQMQFPAGLEGRAMEVSLPHVRPNQRFPCLPPWVAPFTKLASLPPKTGACKMLQYGRLKTLCMANPTLWVELAAPHSPG